MTRILHAKVETGQPLLATDITNLTFFPVGTILMMDGSWENGRGGWYICDGENGTPDLRDKFIKGSGSETAEGANWQTLATNNLPSHNHTLTNTSVSGLSTDLGGGHKHSGTGATTNGSGVHAHSVSGATSDTSKTLTGNFTTYVITDGVGDGGINFNSASGILSQYSSGNVLNDPAHGITKTSISGYKGISIDAIHSHKISGTTPPERGTHSHDVNVTTTEGGGSHTHTITGGTISGSVGNTGSSTAFNNMPAYYSVIYIKKMKEYV